MDGVLLHSSPMHDAAYREALSAFSIPNFRYSRVAGMRSADGVLLVLREHGIELASEQIAGLAASKSRIALEYIAAANPIVPGVREVLEALSARWKLAVASSASPAAVHSFLARNGLQDCFQCVIHSGDVRSAKPSPEIFELAIERLGLQPGKSLVVEDAVAGIQAAKAAGAVACGIPSTCGVDELTAAGADAMIDQLEDLLEIGTGE